MRPCIAAVLASALFSGAAFAADLTPVTKAPAAPAPFQWTGFYVGGNIGAGWNAGSAPDNVGYLYGSYYGTYGNGWFDGERRSKSGSITGGLQAGYNYQIGQFVLGVETDLNYLNTSEQYLATSTVDLQPYPLTRPDYNYHLRENLRANGAVDWFGTIRARVGMTPVDRLLVYATGGAAYAQVAGSASYDWHEYGFWWGGPGDHSFNRMGGFSGSSKDVRWGWTVGGGAEYAITNNLTIKGEYLYIDLGSQDYTVAESPTGDEFITWSNATKLNIVRVGMNYKF